MLGAWICSLGGKNSERMQNQPFLGLKNEAWETQHPHKTLSFESGEVGNKVANLLDHMYKIIKPCNRIFFYFTSIISGPAAGFKYGKNLIFNRLSESVKYFV